MKSALTFAITGFFLLISPEFYHVAVAQEVSKVTDIRIGAYSNKTRIVLDVSDPTSFNVLRLSKPARIVIDMPHTIWSVRNDPDLKSVDTYIKSIRRSKNNTDASLRLVFDVDYPATIQNSFALPATDKKSDRIVIDIEKNILNKTSYDNTLKPKPKPEVKVFTTAVLPSEKITPLLALFAPIPQQKPEVRSTTTAGDYLRLPVIALDAGHGGIDPGAVRAGIREKDLVLGFTNEIAKALRATKRFKVVMTRKDDTYLALSERVDIAVRSNADLFLSFHADTIAQDTVSGMSFFILSDEASDEEALELVNLENKADILSVFDLEPNTTDISRIVIDLSQQQKINASEKLARSMVHNLSKVINVHKRPVRKAGFRVLKVPNTPSILIELGFLSNVRDRKNLQSARWRRKVIKSMIETIDTWYTGQSE